jgi:hypothetical protein
MFVHTECGIILIADKRYALCYGMMEKWNIGIMGRN